MSYGGRQLSFRVEELPSAVSDQVGDGSNKQVIRRVDVVIFFVTAISTENISDWMFHVDSGEAGPSGAFSMASQAVGFVVLSIRAVALQHDVIAI